MNPSGKPYPVGPGGLSPADFARWYSDASGAAWSSLDMDAVGRLVAEVLDVRRRGAAVYVMGNGGSAATSSHIATDLCKTAAVAGKPPIRCVSLADNASFITAAGNDIGFAAIFTAQLDGLLREGDLVLMVSGSGNSANLLTAAALAKERGARTAALLGFDGGKLKPLVDVPVLVKSEQYGVIEDLHLAVGHIVAFFMHQER
ncbi:MAG: SIS domain-containing protein [Elusimicrobia bacterium]|nr:SIS domain-containing protein [Elusimicrobiota bacterium]